MAKAMKRVISLLLAVVLVVGTFAGCGKSNKEKEAAITATAVKYTKSGQYTTTVTSKKVDLSGITADNVEVRYMDPDFVPEGTSSGYAEEVSEETSTEATTEAATDTAAEKVNLEEVYTLSAKVESVKAADKKSYEITFTDDKAAENITGSYIVLFKSIKGDNNTASVEVEFPEITLTPDVENVVSDATQAKVTLAIEGSTFEDGISEKDIVLDNAFSDMTVESVSASEKNLTVQLKGSPVRNEAGAYQWGTIKVKPSGIKDGYADVASKIDIQLASVNMDTAALTFENGRISADLKVYGIVDINTLTKDNIQIDGATVEAAEKTDDNTVKLTIAADGVRSVNDFADRVGGKAMKLGDYETAVSVAQAGFWPVFDYVEEDGDDLKITLKLYADNGTFDKDLKADAVGFADDFKDARVESVTVDSDTLATLILSVPANGQTTETFKMSGTVTLAAGLLTNTWGDKTSKEASCTRDYSGETLGRAVSLNADTLLEIQKYTRGKNTTFGCILYWGGVAGKVYSIGKSILEAAGVLESDQARLLREFAGINAKLDQISGQIDTLRQEIKGLVERDIQNKLSDYNSDMELLNKKIRDVGFVYDRARKDLANTDEAYANIDWENMTDEEASEYNHVLIEYILSNAKPENLVYSSFLDDCNILKTKYESVTAMLERMNDSNPICLYDEACSYKYNFDSQAFTFRLAQRVYAETTLIKAYAALAIRYDAGVDPENPNAKTIIQDYSNAMETLQSLGNIGHQASEVKVVPGEEFVKAEGTFISDVMLIGSNNNTSKIQREITGKGYTMVNQNLNEGNGGMKIFLGYKTTTDADDAITGFLLTDAYKGDSYNGATIVPCMGYSDFTEKHGDLNTNGTNKTKSLYLYYYKDKNAEKAVTGLYFDSKGENTISLDGGANGDLNQGTYVYDSRKLYMHCSEADKGVYVRVGEDPSYYPFCYVLGKRVRVWNSKEHSFMEKADWPYALCDRSADPGYYRNWTSEEVNAFLSRMNGRSLQDELRSAGIPNVASLVTGMERAVNFGIVLLWGNYIRPQDSSVSTDQKIYMVGINNGRMINNSEQQYIDYSLFELY